MKFRTTLLLLIVALGIGAYIWFFEKKTMSTDEREEKGKLVFLVKADDVDKIEIKQGASDIVCAKDKAGDWQIEKPLKYRADKSVLRSIAGKFETLDSARVIPRAEIDEKKLDEFGLKKPRLTVLFNASGKDMGLNVGNDTAMGNNLYASVSGREDVLVVDKSVFQTLNKEVKDLRDRELVNFEIGALPKIQVVQGGQGMDLVQESGVWRIASPVRGLADPDKVSGMLRKVKRLRVRDFTSDSPKNLAEYGLDKPRCEIVLEGVKNQPSQTLLFGKEAEKGAVFAMKKGASTVVTVADDVMKDLMRPAQEFRDRKVTHLAQGSIEDIRLKSGDKKLTLAKAGDKWEIREPQKIEADPAQVQKLLGALTGLKITAFVEDKPADYERYGKKEALEIVLKPKNGEAEMIVVGKKFDLGKSVYVKRAASEEVCAVPSDFLKECPLDVLHYVKKQATPNPAPPAPAPTATVKKK